MFDQKRQTWHMPLEQPTKRKSESATATSGGETKAQVLHAIAEGETEQHPSSSSSSAKPKSSRPQSAKESPAPPPPVTSKTFVRRTKLYKG
jgi:hypothetical protein